MFKNLDQQKLCKIEKKISMKIKLNKDQAESMVYAIKGAAERIVYPSKVCFYYDEHNNFVIEVLDEELIK